MTNAPNTSQASSPANIVCDLAEARAFWEGCGTPPAPVLAAFGVDRLHKCSLEGSWDLRRAALENTDVLIRSIRKLPSRSTTDALAEWSDLTFQFGPRAFLYADGARIIGYASALAEAEHLVAKFNKTYAKPSALSGGIFYLIEQRQNDIRCQEVSLSSNTVLGDEAFDLHYGCGSREWHDGFVSKLHEKVNGLSVFEGGPGTGKTSYLRHLMGTLKKSHRFYFIPTSTMGVLSRPDFIGFWADQHRAHASRKFVVVLEDSDAALMTRGTDNREQVSAILNLSDGMLADFLRLQIICTINCTAADIDPALLRPGRLLSHRVFARLDYPQASRLAGHLGKTLPVVRDYSLAEVFAGHDTDEINRPRIGFAA